jgi:hypothetical protein
MDGTSREWQGIKSSQYQPHWDPSLAPLPTLLAISSVTFISVLLLPGILGWHIGVYQRAELGSLFHLLLLPVSWYKCHLYSDDLQMYTSGLDLSSQPQTHIFKWWLRAIPPLICPNPCSYMFFLHICCSMAFPDSLTSNSPFPTCWAQKLYSLPYSCFLE